MKASVSPIVSLTPEENLEAAQTVGLLLMRAVRANLAMQAVNSFELNLHPEHWGILAGVAVELSQAQSSTDSFVRLFRFVVNVCARMADAAPLLHREIQGVSGSAAGTVLAFLQLHAKRHDCPSDCPQADPQ
jgi:hypothetical protein